jgi:hypothetical protein
MIPAVLDTDTLSLLRRHHPRVALPADNSTSGRSLILRQFGQRNTQPTQKRPQTQDQRPKTERHALSTVRHKFVEG